MIRNFSDHAANERTFLAWVRTAIAVMAFGFLVERFDLFLETVAPSLSGRMLSPVGQKFGNFVGLALIVVGTAMVALAMITSSGTPRISTAMKRSWRPARNSTSLWRPCWSCSASRCSCIYRTPSFPRSEFKPPAGHP
jgi:putative membrane protein